MMLQVVASLTIVILATLEASFTIVKCLQHRPQEDTVSSKMRQKIVLKLLYSTWTHSYKTYYGSNLCSVTFNLV